MCGGSYTAPTGAIASPFYPEPYVNSMACIYDIRCPDLSQRQDTWNSKYFRAPKGMRIKMNCPAFNLSMRGSDKTFFQVKKYKTLERIYWYIFKEPWDFSHLLRPWSRGKDSEDKKTHWHFLLPLQQCEAGFQEPLWVQLHLFILLMYRILNQ